MSAQPAIAQHLDRAVGCRRHVKPADPVGARQLGEPAQQERAQPEVPVAAPDGAHQRRVAGIARLVATDGDDRTAVITRQQECVLGRVLVAPPDALCDVVQQRALRLADLVVGHGDASDAVGFGAVHRRHGHRAVRTQQRHDGLDLRKGLRHRAMVAPQRRRTIRPTHSPACG